MLHSRTTHIQDSLFSATQRDGARLRLSISPVDVPEVDITRAGFPQWQHINHTCQALMDAELKKHHITHTNEIPEKVQQNIIQKVDRKLSEFDTTLTEHAKAPPVTVEARHHLNRPERRINLYVKETNPNIDMRTFEIQTPAGFWDGVNSLNVIKQAFSKPGINAAYHILPLLLTDTIGEAIGGKILNFLNKKMPDAPLAQQNLIDKAALSRFRDEWIAPSEKGLQQLENHTLLKQTKANVTHYKNMLLTSIRKNPSN
jgi:hypothetical protein